MKLKTNVNEEKFINLINENRLKMYKTAMAILKNSEDVNDAIQDAILSAYKNINNLENINYFTTWIITILRNKCFDIIKKNKRVLQFDETILENQEKYYDIYKVESSLERTLNKLDEDLREVTVLYYYDELNIKDIASIINIPEGTVKSSLSRARDNIKKILEEEGGNND